MHIHMNGPYTPEQFERMMKFLEKEQEQAIASDNARSEQHKNTIETVIALYNRYVGLVKGDAH